MEANGRWGGAAQLLDQIRKSAKSIDIDEYVIVVDKTKNATEVDDEPFEGAGWEKGFFSE